MGVTCDVNPIDIIGIFGGIGSELKLGKIDNSGRSIKINKNDTHIIQNF